MRVTLPAGNERMSTPTPTIAALRIAAEPAAWRTFGVPLDGAGHVAVGGVTLEVAPPTGETGIAGWGWRGLPAGADLDGITVMAEVRDAEPRPGPLTLVAVDHVVVATGDFDRTVTALDRAGLDRRRVRDAGALRQGFYLAGPAVVEVVGPAESDGAPARLWGVTLVTGDLDAAAAACGPLLGDIRDAVQPGRRIATVRREAGLGVPVALMTPRR
jgi:hypothetical protein